MRPRSARSLSLLLAAALLGGAVTGAGASVLPAPSASADEVRDRQYWLDDYGIRAAWAVTRGAGVSIAIIDSGVDDGHPDLLGSVVDGTDVSGEGAADGTRPVGAERPDHGTMVASLAAGRGSGPDDGVIGAAPEADLLSASLAFGPGARDGDVQVAEAVRWAVDAGADVISLSLTRNTVDWPESWDEAFLYAEQNDVVVIAAAGNRGSGTDQVGAPATIPGVLTVGGVTRAGRASDAASSQGISISVVAPSEQLVGSVPGGGHVLWQGTSGATPIVAGIAALVRAAHPDETAAQVIQRMIGTARPVTATVPDPLYGFGFIDAEAAVRAAAPAVTANPLGSLERWIAVNRRADSGSTVLEIPAPQESVGRDAGAPPVTTGDVLRATAIAAEPLVPLAIALYVGMLLVIGCITAAVVGFARARRTL